jgi:tape measure domain-containing protein
MATRSEELRAVLTLGVTKFAAGLAQASALVKNFAGTIPREIGRSFSGTLASVKGFAGSVSTILKGAFSLSGIGGVVGALGSGLGVIKAINAAADLESLNAEFAVMLGSASKAKGMVAEINKFANSTPFGTAGLSQNAKTLLAFGVSADQILPTLRRLGDVAGSSQERLDSLALAYAQVQSAGKLQGGDVLQFVNAGFNPLTELARTSGKAMTQLRKDMEGGAISADMVAKAFESATSAGGRFFGNTASQSKTWNGMVSSMLDAFQTGLAAMGDSLIKYLKPYLKEALDLSAILPTWGKNVGDALVWGWKWFVEAVKGGEIWGIAKDRLQLIFYQASQNLVGGIVGSLNLLKNLLVTLFTGDMWKIVGLQLQESALLFVATIQRGLAELMPNVYGSGNIIASANEFKANSVRLDKEKAVKDSFGTGGVINAAWQGSLDAFKPVEIYKSQIENLQKQVGETSNKVTERAGLGKAPWSDGLAAMFPMAPPSPDLALQPSKANTSRASVGGVDYSNYQTLGDVARQAEQEKVRAGMARYGLDPNLISNISSASAAVPRPVGGKVGGVDYGTYQTYEEALKNPGVPVLSRGADALDSANKKKDADKEENVRAKLAKENPLMAAIQATTADIRNTLAAMEVKVA